MTEQNAQAGVTGSIPMSGPLAALTVPGAVDGWREAHERYGRLPWADLFEDAILLAENGVAVSRSLADDFAQYRAQWVEPISTAYRGKQVYQLPPATQGIAALQILNLLEGFDFSRIPEGGADYHPVIVEAVKLAFADRDECLSDPAFVDIPLEKLLSQDHADERRQLIDRAVAMDGTAVEPGVRRGDEAERTAPTGDTVYFAAADADGLMVSIIQSPHHDFRSGIIAGETGVIPQNRGSFFSLDGTHPPCAGAGGEDVPQGEMCRTCGIPHRN